MSGLQKGEHVCKGFKLNFRSFLGRSEGVGAEVRSTFLNPIQCSGFPPYPSGKEACHFHFRPHGQLIFTSVRGLLALYFPVIFLIPLIPCLKISFFLQMSLLSSRLFCFRVSFSICLSALPISVLRRAFHLSCCLTSFWKVGWRCRNPSHRALHGFPRGSFDLILGL